MSRLRLVLFTDSADPSGLGVHMLALGRALRTEAHVTLPRARLRAQAEFGVERMARETLAVYRAVLQPHREAAPA